MLERLAFYLTCLMLLLSPATCFSENGLEKSMNFQGHLVQSNGTPVTGQHSVKFEIFEVESQGSPGILVWDQDSTVNFENGFFVAVLADLNQTKDGRANVFESSGDKLFEMQISVDGVIYPRIRLRSVATAISASRLQGKSADKFLQHADFNVPGGLLVGSAAGVSSVSAGLPGHFLRMGSNNVLEWREIRQVPDSTGAPAGTVLTAGASGTFSWQHVSALPTTTGQTPGNVLTYNGANVEWLPVQALPPIQQGSQSKVLTINQNDEPVWETLSSGYLPSQIPANNTISLLSVDSNSVRSWIGLGPSLAPALASELGSLSANNQKVLGISGGNLAWVEGLPTPDSLPDGEFELQLDKESGNTDRLSWKSKSPNIFFQASASIAQTNASSQWRMLWSYSDSISSNEKSALRSDNAIQLADGGRSILFDYVNYPGIYRVEISVTLPNMPSSVDWHVIQVDTTSFNQQSILASWRFSPNSMTATTAVLIRVELQKTHAIAIVPNGQPVNDGLYNRICIQRIGDIPTPIEEPSDPEGGE